MTDRTDPPVGALMIGEISALQAWADDRARVAAEAEREACAKACEELAHFSGYESAPFDAAIRARSTAATDIPPRIAAP